MSKAPNYTDAQTSELVEAYKAADTQTERDAVVTEFADAFGKSKASIRAKLSREGVYKRKEYATKTGEKPARKDALVEVIAGLMGEASSEGLPGLEKAGKPTLRKLIKALSTVDEADEGGEVTEG